MHGRPASATLLDFLSGGGNLGALIRSRDWTATPLGLPHAWLQTLKTLVSVMLGSSQPMIIAWGPERSFRIRPASLALTSRCCSSPVTRRTRPWRAASWSRGWR
jgi:hypothetical protein